VIKTIRSLLWYIRTRQSLPGRITNTLAYCLPLWCLFKLRVHSCPPELERHEYGCVVRMPILRGRYSFTLLRWCSLIYDRVVVIWDPTVQDLARLLAEGRMMLAIPEVIWMTSPPTDLSSPDRWNYIRASDDDREPPEGITCLEVRPDMGEAPPREVWYCLIRFIPGILTAPHLLQLLASVRFEFFFPGSHPSIKTGIW
jgi:hypothetical protein